MGEVIVEPSEKSPLLRSQILDLSDAHGHANVGPCQTAVDADDGRDEGKRGCCNLCSKLSGRKKYTLIVVAVASFLSGVAFSLIAPFFPRVAGEKGMNLTTIGLVFGIFELIMFLSSPIFGNCLVTLGPRFVYLAGIFVAACSNILFGTLEYCPGGTPFIVLSLLTRSMTSVGVSAAKVAGFAIVSNEFKSSIGLTIGVLKTASGFGFMLGPTIGAAFYELGGFSLPFYVSGFGGLLNIVAVWIFLPQVETPTTKRRGSMWTLLRSPMVAVPLCSVFFGMIGLTTYESTFSRHLMPLNLSVGMLGVIFGVVACLSSGMSMFWGYISDNKNIQAPIIIAGHLVFAIGYFVLGPSPLFPFLPFSLATVFIGLACIGVSLGCTFIPTMKCMVMGAMELGFDPNVDTYGMVSGLFTSIQTLGGFIGPVGVGYLVQHLDYPMSYTLVALGQLLAMVIAISFFTYRRLRRAARKAQKRNDSLGLK